MLSGFAEKKETLFDLKNRIFKSPNNRIFPKGLTMLLVKKCFFFLVRFGQNKTRNNAKLL